MFSVTLTSYGQSLVSSIVNIDRVILLYDTINVSSLTDLSSYLPALYDDEACGNLKNTIGNVYINDLRTNSYNYQANTILFCKDDNGTLKAVGGYSQDSPIVKKIGDQILSVCLSFDFSAFTNGFLFSSIKAGFSNATHNTDGLLHLDDPNVASDDSYAVYSKQQVDSLVSSKDLTAAELIGGFVRYNVSGSGNLTIQNTYGLFPYSSGTTTTLPAGTYLIRVRLRSATLSYSVTVNFGTPYTVSTTNGVIDDLRSVTLSSAQGFSATITTVAAGSYIRVVIYEPDQIINSVGPAAVTNDYNDLDNTPNGTLVIQKNGSNVASFSAGATSNVTANITVPTQTSQLTNNSGYITNASLSDYVTLSTDQEITGEKTFSADTFLAEGSTLKLNYSDEAIPDDAQTAPEDNYARLYTNTRDELETSGNYVEAPDVILDLGPYYYTDDTVSSADGAPSFSIMRGDTKVARFASYTYVSQLGSSYEPIPKAYITTIGDQYHPSTSIYATTFYGNLNGTATSATNADYASMLSGPMAIDGVTFSNGHNISHYGECSTAASTQIKDVTISDFRLVTGARVIIKFANTNTASNPLLRVNTSGTNGTAKPIMYRGTSAVLNSNSYRWQGGSVIEFIYDGTNWVWVGFQEYTYYASVATSSYYLYTSSGYNVAQAYYSNPTRAIVPYSSIATSDLGTASNRWRTLYLSTSISDGTNTYSLPSSTGTLALTSDIPEEIFCVGQEYNCYDAYDSDSVDYRPATTSLGDNNPKHEGNGISITVSQYVNLTTNLRLSVYIPTQAYVGSIAFPIADQSEHYAYYPIYFRGDGSDHNPTVPAGSVLRLTFRNNAFYNDFYDLADFGVEHEPIVRVGKVLHQSSDLDVYHGALVGVRRDNNKFDLVLKLIESNNTITQSITDLIDGSPIYVSFNGECFSSYPKVPLGFILNVEQAYTNGQLSNPSSVQFDFVTTDGTSIADHIVVSPDSEYDYHYFHIDDAPVYLLYKSNTGHYISIGGIPAGCAGRLIGYLCKGAKNAGMFRLVQSADTNFVTVTTDQTITGEKTISEDKLKIGNDLISNYAFKHGQEFIIGTQTASTYSWTGRTSQPALYDGMCINYYLPYASSNSSYVTLNLTLPDNTTTGAVNVYYRGSNRITTQFPVGSIIQLTYVENKTLGSSSITGWLADSFYVDGNTQNYTSQRYTAGVKAGQGGIYGYQLLFRVGDGLFETITLSSYTASTTKTPNPHGLYLDTILYYGSSTTITSGNNTSTSVVYTQCEFYSLYDFNVSSFTAYQPIYLVGTINNGKFYLDSTTWWSQTLPSSANGKYYVYIGHASGTYAYLAPFHPIFYFENGSVKQFTFSEAVSGSVSVSPFRVYVENTSSRNEAIEHMFDDNGTLTINGKSIIIYNDFTDSSEYYSTVTGYLDPRLGGLDEEWFNFAHCTAFGPLMGDDVIPIFYSDTGSLSLRGTYAIPQYGGVDENDNDIITTANVDYNLTNITPTHVSTYAIQLCDPYFKSGGAGNDYEIQDGSVIGAVTRGMIRCENGIFKFDSITSDGELCSKVRAYAFDGDLIGSLKSGTGSNAKSLEFRFDDGYLESVLVTTANIVPDTQWNSSTHQEEAVPLNIGSIGKRFDNIYANNIYASHLYEASFPSLNLTDDIIKIYSVEREVYTGDGGERPPSGWVANTDLGPTNDALIEYNGLEYTYLNTLVDRSTLSFKLNYTAPGSSTVTATDTIKFTHNCIYPYNSTISLGNSTNRFSSVYCASVFASSSLHASTVSGGTATFSSVDFGTVVLTPSDSSPFALTVNNSIVPYKANDDIQVTSWDLGASGNKWDNVYATYVRATSVLATSFVGSLAYSSTSSYTITPVSSPAYGFTVYGRLMPASDYGHSLGYYSSTSSSCRRWNYLYCKYIGSSDSYVTSAYITNVYGTCSNATNATNLSYISGSTVTTKLTATSSQITAYDDIIPNTSSTSSSTGYDLGSSSYKWKSLYISGGHSSHCIIVDTDSSEPTIRPDSTNWGYLGSSNYHWCGAYINSIHTSSVYADNLYINNSWLPYYMAARNTGDQAGSIGLFKISYSSSSYTGRGTTVSGSSLSPAVVWNNSGLKIDTAYTTAMSSSGTWTILNAIGTGNHDFVVLAVRTA